MDFPFHILTNITIIVLSIYSTGKVGKLNKTNKLPDVLRLTKQVMYSDEMDWFWPDCCQHVIELEKNIIELENIRVEFVRRPQNRIIIDLQEDSDSSSSSSSVLSTSDTIELSSDSE
jgi:hypothetical protein